MTVSRRQMIAKSVRIAAAASILSPLLARAGERGFKIGVCEWSLRKSDPSSLDLAREIGFDGVMVDVGSRKDHIHLRDPAMQQAYEDASRRTGVQIASLGMTELVHTPLKSDPRACIWIIDCIAVTQAMGLKVLQLPFFAAGEIKGDPVAIGHVAEYLKELAPHAEKAGVILGLENNLNAADNLDLLQRIGSPAVQVYYDVGNSSGQGYDIYQEIRTLKGHICELHAKDGKHMLGQGPIDFHKVRQAVDDIDYRGWVHVEAAVVHSLVEDYRADLAYLRPIFPPTVA